jgi:DNA-binding winged helix-turn-helix (wHTH) protein/TolB-like protein/tetratricopeptide (TPR) repeat protein
VSAGVSEVYEFDGYRLDARKRLLTLDGESIALMPKAFETLLFFVKHAGQTIEKDEILRAVWPDTVVEENNLTQNVSALRRVFGEKPGEHRYIVTIPGRGYRFVANVRTSDDASKSEPPSSTSTSDTHPGPVSTEQARARFVSRHTSVALVILAVAVLAAFGVYLSLRVESHNPVMRTVAVLPFKPTIEAKRNEAMEFGMADTLITQLSKSDHLIVRPLNATRRFASLDQDAISAGRILGVGTVVEGTIEVEADRLRISTRVIRVADGKQLWAEQFDERFVDIFSVQDSIARQVANALETRLVTATKHATESIEAYELYMRGQLHRSRLVMPEVRKGIEYYERAILADPSYALPYVGIAEAQRSLVLSNDVRASEVIPRAKIAALRALELAPDLVEVHCALGMIAFWYDWDWVLAEKHLSRAIKLGPNNADAHILYAHFLSNLGRKEESLFHARKARGLNPTNLLINALEGQFLGHQGEMNMAIERLKAAVDLEPNFWLSHHLLANALIDQGNYIEAIEETIEAKRLSPLQTYSDVFRAIATARLGRREEAENILNDLLRLERERYVPPTHIAMIYAALGKKEQAMAHLEQAFVGKDARMTFLKIDPKWNDLRTEPLFADLMKRMNYQHSNDEAI